MSIIAALYRHCIISIQLGTSRISTYTDGNDIIPAYSRVGVRTAGVDEARERVRVFVEEDRWRATPKGALGARVLVRHERVDLVAAVVVDVPWRRVSVRVQNIMHGSKKH